MDKPQFGTVHELLLEIEVLSQDFHIDKKHFDEFNERVISLIENYKQVFEYEKE